jgi:hypothetical protein
LISCALIKGHLGLTFHYLSFPINSFLTRLFCSENRKFEETFWRQLCNTCFEVTITYLAGIVGRGSELLDRHFVFLILNESAFVDRRSTSYYFPPGSFFPKIENRRTSKMALRLDGKVISAEIRENLRVQVEKIRENDDSFRPGLAIVQVGDREDSNVYIRMKLRGAKEIGMNAQHIKLSRY